VTEKLRTFPEMQRTLIAGAASGMNTVITLEPESAKALARILEIYQASQSILDLDADFMAILDRLREGRYD
jgi:hypothetical protein